MKVLVARCDRLGDLVLSLPAVAWLRRARPDWEIHALVAPATEPLVEHDPAIDAFYTWNPLLSDRRLPQLRDEGYDAAVLLQFQTPLARLVRDAGVPRRHGPLSKPSSLLWLNRGSLQRRSRTARHESAFNLDLVRRLAGRGASAEVRPPAVHVGAGQLEVGRRFRLTEAAGAEVVAFVHPGSGGSALDWSPASFAATANALSRRPGWRVFVTGSHHDRLMIDALAPLLEPQVAVVAERFPLRDLLGVLAAGDLMVAPSTGPLHLAAALGLAAVGVYPPAPTMSPARWGVLGPWSASITPPVTCPARRHCLLEHCLLHNCLDGVVPSRVIDTAVDLVDRRCRARARDGAAAYPGDHAS
jgi:ADP-heptose:LPS heptosyltransferase